MSEGLIKRYIARWFDEITEELDAVQQADFMIECMENMDLHFVVSEDGEEMLLVGPEGNSPSDELQESMEDLWDAIGYTVWGLQEEVEGVPPFVEELLYEQAGYDGEVCGGDFTGD